MTGKDSEGRGRFPVTRWSLVARSCASSDSASIRALNELLRVYCPVLTKHLERDMKFSRHRAEDMVQDFVASKIMDKKVLAGVSAGKGRFRDYLLVVFDNFAIGEIRRHRAKKRGPHNDRVLSLDEAPDLAMTDDRSHRLFDLDWARQTLVLAVERMKAECDAKGRRDLWEVFSCRVLDPALDRTPAPSYEALVERFGFRSPSQASNCLVTAKRMFRRALVEVVRDTVASEDRVEEELANLRAILSD